MPSHTGHTVGVGSSMGVISPASALFAMITQGRHPYINVVITGSVHKIIICDKCSIYLSI